MYPKILKVEDAENGDVLIFMDNEPNFTIKGQDLLPPETLEKWIQDPNKKGLSMGNQFYIGYAPPTILNTPSQYSVEGTIGKYGSTLKICCDEFMINNLLCILSRSYQNRHLE